MMYKDYSKYKASDFLQDDLFLDSMLHPTQESDRFWKKLIMNEKIDVNEFIYAFRILKEIQKNKPEVDDAAIENVWKRIVGTNSGNVKRYHRITLMKYAAVACLFLLLGGLYLFIYQPRVNSIPDITDFAKKNIIHTRDDNQNIRVYNGKESLALDGNQADLVYDSVGQLHVKNESVAVPRQPKRNSEKEPVYNQLKVPYGKRAFLTLSDGTTLWINTGTTVIYPVAFTGNKREIFVEGEIFANVTHDKKRPFIVKTGKLDVKVLGTVFNLTAYKDDDRINVVLVSGLVNVKPENGKATIINPNQLYSYTDQSATLRNVDVDDYISWKDGIYVFKNEPIEDILLRLSRYYNVTMKLPSSPSGINCSGKLELKEDLNELLNGLSEITSMSYGVKDDEYKISFR